jgi:hypothetical protein
MRGVHVLAALGIVLFAVPVPASAAADADIAAANAAGHAVFLLVTEGDSPAVAAARTVAGEAKKLAPGTSVLEVNRREAANEATVRRYRLASVPVPMILVIASNGVAAGGARPQNLTAERLAAMIPSPAKAAWLKALEEKKAPILVLARRAMADRPAALKAATDAVVALRDAAAAIEVDLDAEREASFAAEVQVDVKTTVPWVAVYNAKGKATRTFTGVPKVEDVVAAARMEAPCCPGGRCGPEGGR